MELGGAVWILTYTTLEHVAKTHLPSGPKAASYDWAPEPENTVQQITVVQAALLLRSEIQQTQV